MFIRLPIFRHGIRRALQWEFSTKDNQNDHDAIKEQMDKMKALIDNADKEIEDYDFENRVKSPYWFKAPPTSDEEKIKLMEEVDHWLNKYGKFLAGTHIQLDLDEQRKKKLAELLPQKLEVWRLRYPPTETEIFMVGVDRYSYMHATWIKDLLNDVRPENIFVELPCDEPYFVKNTKN